MKYFKHLASPNFLFAILIGIVGAVLVLHPVGAEAAIIGATGINLHHFAPLVVMGGILDIFKEDIFSTISLTDAVNKLPFVPGRAGTVINWNERGSITTGIMIEEKNGVLNILNPSPRGGPGTARPKTKRTARTLTIPHYQSDDGVMADEVQGIRAFGSETQLQTVYDMVQMRMQEHVQLELDPTLEFQRIGAIKGVILNGDGSTLYDLFSEFGVSQEAEVTFALSATTSDGSTRTTCASIVRKIAQNLGGAPFQRIYGFAGDGFWDKLVASKETRETFLNQAEASQLRGSSAYQQFEYGGIMFENYRGAVGIDGQSIPQSFVDSDKCHFFALGVPGLWRTVYAPADYIETVNTPGLPRYAKQWPMDNDKGINMEMQTNALNYCTRPKTLIQGSI